MVQVAPAIGPLASSWRAWPARDAALGADRELAAARPAVAVDANHAGSPIAMEVVRAADRELAATLALAFARAAALAAAAAVVQRELGEAPGRARRPSRRPPSSWRSPPTARW